MNQQQPQNDYPFYLDTRGMTIEEEIARIEKAGFQKRWGSVWEWERVVSTPVAHPSRVIPCVLLLIAVAIVAVLFCGVIPATPYDLVIYFVGGLLAAGFYGLSIKMFGKINEIKRNSKTEVVEYYNVKRLHPVEKMIREVYFRPDTFNRAVSNEDSARCSNCKHYDRCER